MEAWYGRGGCVSAVGLDGYNDDRNRLIRYFTVAICVRWSRSHSQAIRTITSRSKSRCGQRRPHETHPLRPGSIDGGEQTLDGEHIVRARRGGGDLTSRWIIDIRCDKTTACIARSRSIDTCCFSHAINQG